MSFDVLKKQIKDNGFSHKMHFFGEEVYLKNAYLKRVREIISEKEFEDFNYMLLEDEANARDADAFVNTALIMGDKKLLVLKNTGIFKNANTNAVFWKNTFTNVPDHLYIIACEDAFDKRNAVYKAFCADCLSVDFQRRTRDEIKGYFVKMAAREGIKVEAPAAELFAESIANDLFTVNSEADKLISACRESGKITKDDVLQNTTREYFTKEYVMTDAVLKRDCAAALKALSELTDMRFDPVKLLFIVSSAYISTYNAKMLLENRVPYDEIVKSLRLPHSFLAKKYTDFARKLSVGYLENALELLKTADRDIKSGNADPETCLKTLICRLS